MACSNVQIVNTRRCGLWSHIPRFRYRARQHQDDSTPQKPQVTLSNSGSMSRSCSSKSESCKNPKKEMLRESSPDRRASRTVWAFSGGAGTRITQTRFSCDENPNWPSGCCLCCRGTCTGCLLACTLRRSCTSRKALGASHTGRTLCGHWTRLGI
jgi:hypothetical protein